MKPSAFATLAILPLGCTTHGGPKNSGPALGAANEPETPAQSADVGPGRRYRAADMQFKPCVKRVGNTFVGRDCLATVLVYGPYADVPSGSRVTVGFDVQGPTLLGVYSDLTAQIGSQRLGSLWPVRVPRGEKGHVEYSVYVEEAATAVEARIWLHGRGPVDFEITNLSVRVR